ncbi:hypothetical protein SAMN02745671_01896 [Anaerovibrio lipolyticus DSM 3074]|uniref:Uncharacterized protein n=1 Tax=Anaerovibrio lipolyticus DSM 3074 TaxID=1120997 RepID=A0A1M6EI73_9FIRM|nr:hypothetical protein SAMN02745671_01896 [Anaerovibrio lipolyticus DSM 3074]
MKNYRLALSLILAALLSFACLNANISFCQAAQWEWVTSTDEVDYEIDVSTVQRVQLKFAGDNVICWIKTTTLDNKYGMAKFAFRDKNGIKQYVMLSGTGYDENGNVTGWAPTISEPFDFHYRTINKGSFYEALYDKAMECVAE